MLACCAEAAWREGTLEKAEHILGSLFDEKLIDLFALQFEADEQARVGKQIDEARNTAREAVNHFDSGASKWARAAQAGGVKAFRHVGANFGKAERTQQAGAGNALLERLEFGALKNRENSGWPQRTICSNFS